MKSPGTEALYTDVKLTNIRRVIAKSMHASLSTMAQLTLNTSFDASAILAYRARVKARGEEPQRYGSLRLREDAAVA